MAEAFIRQQGMKPTLLPTMIPVGDIDEDELILNGENAQNSIDNISQSISPLERTFLFMKIITSLPQEFGSKHLSLYQAYALASELGCLIDMAHNESLNFSNLADLVPEEYSEHWQKTLHFLEIITSNWPLILSEKNAIDSSLRKKLLLEQQIQIWKNNPPNRRIIIAATTAAFPTTKQLVKTITELPQGEVVLCGLDKYLDDESWQNIDETHPQYELKRLLDFLKYDRYSVTDIIPPKNLARELLISEVMRPATQTDLWREIKNKPIDKSATEGIKILNCADNRDEALCIAIIMRHALETPNQAASLITPDRNLARRVSSELARWNINIDDTAGIPLHQTPWGVFMRLVIAAASPESSRTTLLSLLKNPLCCLGMDRNQIREQTKFLEKEIWRKKQNQNTSEILVRLQEALQPLTQALLKPFITLPEIIKNHILVAQNIASNSSQNGAQVLWKGESGNVGSSLLEQCLSYGNTLDNFNPKEYLNLFEALAANVPVRPKYGTHPRLKIMGPIEARHIHSDIMILGGFNEGIWPQKTASDPWLSRPMKKDFGFPVPEKSIGITGLDLSCFLGAKQIYLTRAEKSEGSPTIKSRWLMRLETVLKALEFDIKQLETDPYLLISKHIDTPDTYCKTSSPAPCPPLALRPRQLSASGIELLMRDPYSVYAKYILRLKPLEDIDPEPNSADFDSIIHEILEEFNNLYPHDFPADGKEKLLEIGYRKFSQNPILQSKKVFWWPKFAKMIDHLSKLEKEYRPSIKFVHNEIEGSFTIKDLPGGAFTITAKADRIDETIDGSINIIDYKTGKTRSKKEVALGYAPQLPIEGLIAQSRGFKEIKPAQINQLIYWQLGNKDTVVSDNLADILETNKQNLTKLLNLFDFETTPYICNPNPRRASEYSDYEHLARIKEWHISEDSDD